MQEINVSELKSRLDNGENIYILDVREPDEFASYNIGGQLLPLGQVMSMQLGDLEDKKEDEIIVHCKSGKRSMQACLVLETMGFQNVKNLTGGVVAWQEQFG